jgi:hypothetical protein
MIVVKTGKNKNWIVEEGFANNRKDAFEKNKQSLVDAGLHAEAGGYIFVKNYKIKVYKD